MLLWILGCAPPPPVTSSAPLVESDADTDADSDTDTDSDTDADPTLAEVEDHSVNRASVSLDTDPETGDGGLLVRTEEGDNEVGAFHGSGTGNKAIAGVPGFDGLPLAELDGLGIQARPHEGERELYLNVLVDLACDGQQLRILVVDSWGETGVDSGGYLDLSADPGAPVWKAVGGIDELLPGHLEADRATLTPLAQAYPDACLRDADTLDGGMPADVETRAILWILGDSSNTSANAWYVREVSIGDLALRAP